MTTRGGEAPTIPSALVERVLTKLGIDGAPTHDIAGLNPVYAAYCGAVPNDNIRKRIWLAGDRAGPMPGGDPADFFTYWLDHGTGGTCFAANGALCALLRALGFDAWRISGAVLMDGLEHDGNHGSVLAKIDGVTYFVDAQLASFAALPLIAGKASSTGDGIHDISAVPTEDGFDISWYPGANRERPLIMRPDLAKGQVDHDYFLTQYALSAARDRRRSPFNEAVFVGRHFRESILIVSRDNRIQVHADNRVSKREINLIERARVLVEELGISEEIANAIPLDEELPS
jgi:arylamine N-acetyltransferase